MAFKAIAEAVLQETSHVKKEKTKLLNVCWMLLDVDALQAAALTWSLVVVYLRMSDRVE